MLKILYIYISKKSQMTLIWNKTSKKTILCWNSTLEHKITNFCSLSTLLSYPNNWKNLSEIEASNLFAIQIIKYPIFNRNKLWNFVHKIISHLLFIFATSFVFCFADAFVSVDFELIESEKHGPFSFNTIADNNKALTSYYKFTRNTWSIASL